MAEPDAFYVSRGVREHAETFEPTGHTTGAWDPGSQHGGPPSALLMRAIESVPPSNGAPMTVSRLTVDLLGAAPLRALDVRVALLRPGRSVELVQSELLDPSTGRVVARGTAWRVPHVEDGPVTDWVAPLPPPEQAVSQPWPESWSGGYIESVEWAWVEGAVDELGGAVVWLRPGVALVDGETMSPLQRLMVCADSANGAGAVLDIADWRFLNTDLTVHVLREPRGEWLGMRARTDVAGGASGIAVAEVHDVDGLVARSHQALLVLPRA